MTDAQGWFATRDVGQINQGELLLTGCLDNPFFSVGEGIQRERTELILLLQPDVSEACGALSGRRI